LIYDRLVARRRRQEGLAWSPNQIVAYNVAKARLLRGWTQEQAAEALAPYLGTRLSAASFSAIERSVAGGRIREFTADEIVALARGFNLPIGWFFTPPSLMEGIGVATPDADERGLDPQVMLDSILGTPETLADWERILLTWPAGSGHRVRMHDDGTVEDLGRAVPDVHDRAARLRARVLLRQEFGDLDEAHRVLERLAALLEELDQEEPHDTKQDEPARKRRAAKPSKSKRKRSTK
jgi:transcriptional regulator with XRE-family HTH domain